LFIDLSKGKPSAMGCQSSKYKRSYAPSEWTTTSSATKQKLRDNDCKFFLQARAKLARDYILVIDRSGSMGGDKWNDAREAVEFFVGSICDFDPDGITVILFDDGVVKFDNVRDPEYVKRVFNDYGPCGSTDLAKALDAAFQEHFASKRGSSTVLVITDGSPNSREEAEKVIQKAANSITSDEELSVSFVQIGNDGGARSFLKYLDDDLTARFDIVDVVVTSDLKEMSFADVIRKSMCD
jgi:Mg-chelatase subunit ChlD